MSNSISDISQVLLFDPKFLDPSQPTGFWFCSDPEDVLAIQINAGCLRTLGDWNTIGQYEPFFLQFCYVLVVCADPEKRAVMVKELRHRLPNVILLAVEDKGFRRCSSVRALRDTYGLKAVDQILLDTVEIPAYGLLDLADVKQPDSIASTEKPKTIRVFTPPCCSAWRGKDTSGYRKSLPKIYVLVLRRHSRYRQTFGNRSVSAKQIITTCSSAMLPRVRS